METRETQRCSGAGGSHSPLSASMGVPCSKRSPAPLVEVSGPKVTAATVGNVWRGVAAFRTLTRSVSWSNRRTPGFKQRMQRIHRNVAAGLPLAPGQQVKQARRKRKKKRKENILHGSLLRSARHVRGDLSVSRFCLLSGLMDNAFALAEKSASARAARPWKFAELLELLVTGIPWFGVWVSLEAGILGFVGRRLQETVSVFSANAWFDSGYMYLRQPPEAV